MVMMMMLKAGIRGAPPLPSVHVSPQPFTEVFAPAAHYSSPPPSQPKLARTLTISFHVIFKKSTFHRTFCNNDRASPTYHPYFTNTQKNPVFLQIIFENLFKSASASRRLFVFTKVSQMEANPKNIGHPIQV